MRNATGGGDTGTTPGRAGLIALLLCSLCPMMGLFSIGVALPKVAAAFGDDPDAELLAQLIGGASGFAFAVASPAIGALIDRHGYRRVYIASLIGFALFGALPALLDSLPLILATRLVFGVAVAGAMTAGMTGLGGLPHHLRARMFGRNAMVSSVGAIISFPLVGALATLGWRIPFLLHLLSLLVVPLALTLDRVAPVPHAVKATPRPAGGIGVSAAVLMMAAFVGLAMYTGPIFSPFYLRTIGVTDPTLAALPLSAMSMGSLMMTANYGRLHARFGTTALFGATLALVGCGLVGAGFSPVLPLFAISMFTVSCGLAMFTPNLGAYISATSHRPARGIGWAMSAMFAVQVVFPFLARGVGQAIGPASIFHILGAISLAIASGFIIAALRRRRIAQISAGI